MIQAGIGKYIEYFCVLELLLREEKEKGYQTGGDCSRFLLLRITQRLCLPSSLSSAEPALDDANDVAE